MTDADDPGPAANSRAVGAARRLSATLGRSVEGSSTVRVLERVGGAVRRSRVLAALLDDGGIVVVRPNATLTLGPAVRVCHTVLSRLPSSVILSGTGLRRLATLVAQVGTDRRLTVAAGAAAGAMLAMALFGSVGPNPVLTTLITALAAGIGTVVADLLWQSSLVEHVVVPAPVRDRSTAPDPTGPASGDDDPIDGPDDTTGPDGLADSNPQEDPGTGE